MSYRRYPTTSARSGTAVARGHAWVSGRATSEARFGQVVPGLAVVAWVVLRSTALIAVAVVLVFVVLPAVLGAAGAQVTAGL